MLSLNLKLGLQQKLSPQQIQYQKLLQLNTLSLEQRIKTELELNPFLEETLAEELDISQNENETDDEDTEDEYDYEQDEFGIEDFMNDESIDEGTYAQETEEERLQPIAPMRVSLSDNLIQK